ncbi:hypothetical protein [Chakrabartyella piscis]|uniref:hypothetical protein n=1 Tax=Chakrabartyella piscis TaxID=2918914 RepID=UPI00295857AF|nr:hypothetical protein [Chakrabartyella piscis]
MKRIVLIWLLYVSFAVVILPAWLTLCMGGFDTKEEMVYNEEVIYTMEMEETIPIEKNLL